MKNYCFIKIMIDGTHIREWIANDPTGLITRLHIRNNETLQVIANWVDEKTGDTFLHIMLKTYNIHNCNCLAGRAILSFHLSLSHLIERNPAFLKHTNKDGQTIFDLFPLPPENSECTETIKIMSNTLIHLKAHCSVNKALEFANYISQTCEGTPLIKYAINLLFHQANYNHDIQRHKALHHLAFALPTGKGKNVKLLHDILYTAMPQLLPKHFETYKQNDEQYIELKKYYYIHPTILKAIQLLLSEYCDQSKETLCNVATLKDLVKPTSSEKDLFKFFGIIKYSIGNRDYLKIDLYCNILDAALKSSAIDLAENIILNIFDTISKEDKDLLFMLQHVKNKVIENSAYGTFYLKIVELGANKVLKMLLSKGSKMYPIGTKLLTKALRTGNVETAAILCDAGVVSPNYPMDNPAISIKDVNNTPEIIAFQKRYWLCDTSTLQNIKFGLHCVCAGILAASLVLALYLSTYIINIIDYTEFAKAPLLYCIFSAPALFIPSFLLVTPVMREIEPYIVPDTISWIMRKAEKCYNEIIEFCA